MSPVYARGPVASPAPTRPRPRRCEPPTPQRRAGQQAARRGRRCASTAASSRSLAGSSLLKLARCGTLIGLPGAEGEGQRGACRGAPECIEFGQDPHAAGLPPRTSPVPGGPRWRGTRRPWPRGADRERPGPAGPSRVHASAVMPRAASESRASGSRRVAAGAGSIHAGRGGPAPPGQRLPG